MASQDQYIQLSSLPEDVRKEVLDFIAFLMQRRLKQDAPEKPVRNTPIGGLAKGLVTIPKDFDAPLDDFKEYME